MGVPWVMLLAGPAWVELGAIGVAAHDDGLAIALSRGLHPKGYPHVDANEDAVVGAAGDGGRMVAVLDGHRGYDAAGAAAQVVVAAAPALVGAATVGPGDLRDVLVAAREAVAAAVAGQQGERAASRTALTLAVARDGRLLHATWGDTSLALLRPRRAAVVSREAAFLGPATLPRVADTRLRPGGWVVAVSDGLTTFAGPRWARLATARAGLPPDEACIDLVSPPASTAPATRSPSPSWTPEGARPATLGAALDGQNPGPPGVRGLGHPAAGSAGRGWGHSDGTGAHGRRARRRGHDRDHRAADHRRGGGPRALRLAGAARRRWRPGAGPGPGGRPAGRPARAAPRAGGIDGPHRRCRGTWRRPPPRRRRARARGPGRVRSAAASPSRSPSLPGPRRACSGSCSPCSRPPACCWPSCWPCLHRGLRARRPRTTRR